MPSILILDNSVDVLEIFTLIFKNNHFETNVCNSADAMFEKLQVAIPDVLILDVRNKAIRQMMIDGELRRRNALRNIPILITSTHKQDVENYFDFGANDAIEKPFDLNNLLDKVNAIVR